MHCFLADVTDLANGFGSGQNGNDVIQYENDSVQRGLYGHDYAPVPALSK